jgi:three-Cys-motif partner protein
MTKKPKETSVGPWAKEKLDALHQYLNFYTAVLKNQGHWLRGTFYVDAFAGPGLSRIRTESGASESSGLFGPDPESDQAETEFLKGSPRVALDIANPFSSYLFVERDPHRIVELESIKAEYGDKRRIIVQEADANAALKAWLASGIDWRRHRAVVFLDPFGMQAPWSTIESLARTKAIEVMINFPMGMAIQRLLTRSGEIPECWQMSLDTFFGSQDWRTITYEEGKDLFGPKTIKVSNAGARLLEWYRTRLRQAFGNVSTARLIKNTRGNPLYHLIWAGPNATGLKGAEHILRKGERVHPSRGRHRGEQRQKP